MKYVTLQSTFKIPLPPSTLLVNEPNDHQNLIQANYAKISRPNVIYVTNTQYKKGFRAPT